MMSNYKKINLKIDFKNPFFNTKAFSLTYGEFNNILYIITIFNNYIDKDNLDNFYQLFKFYFNNIDYYGITTYNNEKKTLFGTIIPYDLEDNIFIDYIQNDILNIKYGKSDGKLYIFSFMKDFIEKDKFEYLYNYLIKYDNSDVKYISINNIKNIIVENSEKTVLMKQLIFPK
jgi:hypothetical protein